MTPAEVAMIRGRQIFLEYEPYRSMCPNEIGHRIDVPAEMQRLQHWMMPGEGEVMFTWARPSRQENILKLIDGTLPDHDFWEDHDPRARLWIVDMAGTRGVSGIKVGRLLSCALVATGIAKEGELVIFRRNGGARPGRFGKAIIRG